MIIFNKWTELEKFIIQETNCKPFSGAGICPRPNQKTTILKSIDNTYYYDDDLSNPELVKYTLFGHSGDQKESEIRFNEPLLNPEKTKDIYLYRVKIKEKKKEYIWYGKYKIIDKDIKEHPGKDLINRKIIILNMKKI